MSTQKISTQALHAGHDTTKTAGTRAVPIYQTSSYVFNDTEHAANLFSLKELGFIYTRLNNPTNDILQQRLAAIEGGIGAVVFASGTSAISTGLLTLLKAGDHIVASSSLYGGTFTLLNVTLPRLGITTTFVDASNPENFKKAVQENTRPFFVGSLGNPKLDVLDLKEKVVGFRGDYYELTKEASHKIKNLVYPVPDPKFPFLGVHFTRMVDGSIECGPNAVFTFKREGYNRTSFSLKDTFDALMFKGTWKLFGKHWRKGIDEYKRAFSKQLFVKELQKMMPSLTIDEIVPARSGVRAQAIDVDGNMVDDFKIIKNKQNIHVLNAPSPAATACLAIAEEIVKNVIMGVVAVGVIYALYKIFNK